MKKTWLLILMLFTGASAFAQHLISGKVTDNTGEPMIGVSIRERATNNGTISALDGSYRLNASSSTAVLIFSYTGYEPITLTLTGNAEANVTMTEGATLGEVQVVGSRSYNRSATSSAVAIDVIDAAQLSATSGRVEVNEILQFSAPSFNATRQSGSDGADHIVPASLRGLGPDQTLVLINGKRRHQSSLVNIFGTRGRGNSGTDLNAIPTAAIKRIEVLRDGASAQYGSDAIAGVINIVLKDKTDGVTASLTYGAFSTAVGGDFAREIGEDKVANADGKNRLDGEEKSFDGNTTRLDMNYGVALGDEGGYANFTAEYLSKDRTLRPGYSWRKGYGSAGVDGFNFMVNTAMPIGEKTEFYAFGGRNYRDTDANAFSRGSFADDGDNRAVPTLYPNGFTPRITSIITDGSVSAGLRHTLDNGWKVDFNNTFGRNDFHYFIKNTNNASLWTASPTEFDAGGHSLNMNTTGMDFSKYYDGVAAGLNLAFGMEYRTERFGIFAGQEGSYALYDSTGRAIIDPSTQAPNTDPNGDELPGGSQGFPGYSPANEVDRGRTNLGLYVDSELNITDAFLLSGALRFEDYSDFGNTMNYKVAARYKLGKGLALRASNSSGFRAPSLAQIHYNLIFTNIVNGVSFPSLLSSNTSTVTKAFGIQSLKQETANNTSVGLTYNNGGFTATIDAYSIAVKDRIVLTDAFDASGLGLGVVAAQFFANGVDTRTQGVDVVLGYRKILARNGHSFNFNLAANVNELKIEKIKNGNLDEQTFFGPLAQAYLKAAAPPYKAALMVGHTAGKLDVTATITQFSKVELQDFKWFYVDPASVGGVEELKKLAKDTYDARTVIDFSASYAVTKNLRLTLGANNILNAYPTPQFDGDTDQGGFQDSVQMGSDGAYFFGRVGLTF